MTPTQSNPDNSPRPQPFRWTRSDATQACHDFHPCQHPPPCKRQSACLDENFHGSQPCWVAIEPESGFLLLEAYYPQRDGDTWTAALKQALTGMPVEVIQVTSDRAKGPIACARDGLEAQHTPDLFHVQRELSKAASLPLHRQVQTAQAVALFVRSSSCVEGGNGRLSLYHHGQGPLREGRLRSLTAVHNFVVEDRDGVTAAERFFGSKPEPVFEWLLERMPELPRPAPKRPSASQKATAAA